MNYCVYCFEKIYKFQDITEHNEHDFMIDHYDSDMVSEINKWFVIIVMRKCINFKYAKTKIILLIAIKVLLINLAMWFSLNSVSSCTILL